MAVPHQNAPHRRCRLPAGALGMCILIVVVEVSLTGHELEFVGVNDSQYLQAGTDSEQQAKDCDLLILGDSLTKFGVIPEVVGNRTGSHAHNLAIGGGPPPLTFEVLDRVYQSGARPSAIVVDFSPYLTALAPNLYRSHLPFLLGYSASLKLAWQTREPVLLAQLVTRRALVSLRCRPSLRAWVLHSLAGEPDRDRSVVRETRQHWTQNAGAMVMPAFPGMTEAYALRSLKFFPKRWTPDRVHARYLRAVIELATAHGTRVYWLIPPLHRAVQAVNDVSGFDERYDAFVTAELRRNPGLVVIDGRHSGYDPNVFFDGDHLGLDGAFALSEDLGDVLQAASRSIPADRWLHLPEYRARSNVPAIATARPDACFR